MVPAGNKAKYMLSVQTTKIIHLDHHYHHHLHHFITFIVKMMLKTSFIYQALSEADFL